MAVFQKTFGEHHFEVAKTYHNLSGLYTEKGDSEAALAFAEKAVTSLLPPGAKGPPAPIDATLLRPMPLTINVLLNLGANLERKYAKSGGV